MHCLHQSFRYSCLSSVWWWLTRNAKPYATVLYFKHTFIYQMLMKFPVGSGISTYCNLYWTKSQKYLPKPPRFVLPFEQPLSLELLITLCCFVLFYIFLIIFRSRYAVFLFYREVFGNFTIKYLIVSGFGAVINWFNLTRDLI